MFHLTQTQRSVLGSIILALTMTFGSMSAHSALVSYDLFYGLGSFPNNTFVDATIFLDDADITGGTVEVPLSSVEVTWRQGGQPDIFFVFANDRTDTTALSMANAFFAIYIPFTARFVGNTLTGLNGIQPPSVTGIANLEFAVPVSPGGSQAITLFQTQGGLTAFPGEFNGTKDFSNLSSVSGPFAVAPVSAVPLPAALPLFGSALAMLGIVGWRRRRREAVA